MRRVEIGVGLFILLGILALAFLAIQVSGLGFSGASGETYRLKAQFNDISGLNERARVTMSGVFIGRVTAIHLDPVTGQAIVDMAINKNVDYLSEDSIAAIKTQGILGEKYVSISLGGAPDVLTDGDQIFDTQSSLVLEDLIGKFLGTVTQKE